MTRALVVTLPEKGHYFPLLGPAAALRARGVEALLAAPADIRAELAALGFDRVLVPPGAPPPAEDLRGAALARILADPAALRGWIRRLLVDGAAATVEPMRAIVRDVKPDVVAIDPMAYGAAIAAELEGVPWVGWSTSLNPVAPPDLRSELVDTLRALDPDRHALFAAHGLRAEFRVSDVLSPRGTAAFTTEELVGPAPPGVHLVGPSLFARPEAAFDDAFAGGRPLVYASFGSQAWHQPARFDRLLDAAASLDVALLVAMGDLAGEYRARDLPDRVRCVPFAPQLGVLRRARLAITHGGANSVMEALAHGVPLLVAPICNDQPHDLAFVARAGAGRGIDLETASADAIRRAIAELVEDGPERAAAARIAASYASRSGAEGAAALALGCAR